MQENINKMFGNLGSGDEKDSDSKDGSNSKNPMDLFGGLEEMLGGSGGIMGDIMGKGKKKNKKKSESNANFEGSEGVTATNNETDENLEQDHNEDDNDYNNEHLDELNNIHSEPWPHYTHDSDHVHHKQQVEKIEEHEKKT